MIIVELKSGKWIGSESKRRIEKITGKAGSPESLIIIKNLWYQPFGHKSGVMSDFFCAIKNGKSLNQEIPMRRFEKDLPLTKCLDIEFIDKVQPKWYRDILKAKQDVEHNI